MYQYHNFKNDQNSNAINLLSYIYQCYPLVMHKGQLSNTNLGNQLVYYPCRSYNLSLFCDHINQNCAIFLCFLGVFVEGMKTIHAITIMSSLQHSSKSGKKENLQQILDSKINMNMKIQNTLKQVCKIDKLSWMKIQNIQTSY